MLPTVPSWPTSGKKKTANVQKNRRRTSILYLKKILELNFSRVYSRRSINFVTLRLIIFNLLYYYSGVETSGEVCLLPVTQSKAGAVQKTKTNKNAKLGFYHI